MSEPDALLAITQRARPEDLDRKAAWMERPLIAFFQDRVASGEFAPRSVETLLDLVRSVSLLSLHRDRFGSAPRFDAVADDLIHIVSQGLTKPTAQHDR